MIAGQSVKRWAAGFVAVIALGAMPVPAGAAAQRTFVASHGNDANPCSLAAPCRGFARALTQTADKGEIIAVDSAGYGPVTIDKSVSIIAPAGVYAGISVLTGDGITISTSAITVTLRGLTIAVLGGTRGIYVTGDGSTINVDNCVVSNAFSSGIEFDTGVSARLLVRDSIIRGTVGHGLMATGGTVQIDGSRIEENGGGIVAYNTRIVITRTSIALNAGDGVWIDASGPGNVTTEVSIDSAVLADNGGSGILLTTAGAGHVARAGIGRSILTRNNMAGIWAFSADTSTVYVSATDDGMEQNAYGIYVQQCGGGGYVNAARNTAVGNTVGFFMAAVATSTCVFRSAGDNMVRDNTVDVSGAVTKVTGD